MAPRLNAEDRRKLALVLADFLNGYVGVLGAAVEIYERSIPGRDGLQDLAAVTVLRRSA
jgi:hypothetical protein